MPIILGILFFIVASSIAFAKYFNAPWLVIISGLIIAITPWGYPYLFSAQDYNYGGGDAIFAATFLLIAVGFIVGLLLFIGGVIWQVIAIRKQDKEKPPQK